jgi:hypothetical protein
MKVEQLNQATQAPPAVGRQHPEVLKMVRAIGASKGKWGLSFSFAQPRVAKKRLESLKHARAKGRVKFKQAFRRGTVLYVQTA